MENRKETLALYGMFFITIIWGYCFIATKIAAEHYSPAQINFYRQLIAAVMLAAVFHKDLIKITKKELRNGFVLGMLLYFGLFTQTVAINHTTVAKNAFLTTLYIIFVPIITAAVYKKRIDKFSVISCVLAIAGTGILSLNLDLTINFGDVLSIVCAVFFSLQIFLQDVFVKKTKPSTLVSVQFIAALIFSFFAALFFGEVRPAAFHLKGTLGIAFLGVFGTCISLLLQAICQKYVSPVKTVVVFSLEAVFASIFAVIILHDEITPRFLIGSTVIFAAVIISSTKLSFLRHKQVPSKTVDKTGTMV